MLVATVRLIEVIQRSTTYLEARGVESPRLQVEWILAHALRVPRLQLYLQFERVLDAGPLDLVRTAVQRRGRREPLQYVLGSAVFCGLEFQVGPAALVPRPETELLAERAWTWLLERSAGLPSPQVLDWGTGTGCLAVTVAVKVPSAAVWAVEVSAEAAALAGRNAVQQGVDARVRVLLGDGIAALPGGQGFDLVMSNPPYIPTGELGGLEPEVRDHEPKVALDGGGDGLEFYRRLVVEMAPRVRPGGVVLLEFGDGQGDAVGTILAGAGWVIGEMHRDHTGRERFLLMQRTD